MNGRVSFPPAALLLEADATLADIWVAWVSKGCTDDCTAEMAERGWGVSPERARSMAGAQLSSVGTSTNAIELMCVDGRKIHINNSL